MNTKMTRRTTAAKPEPIPVAEPETTLCPDVPTVIEPRVIVRCAECNFEVWRKGLCFTHWKESQGFVFNETTKTFVKA